MPAEDLLEASVLFVFAEALGKLAEDEKPGAIEFTVKRERANERRWRATLRLGKSFDVTVHNVDRAVALRTLTERVRTAIKVRETATPSN